MSGQSCWRYHNGAEDFTNLMVKFCSEFAETHVRTFFSHLFFVFVKL